MAKDKHLPHWPEVPPGMLSSATASYVEHVAALDGGMTMAEVANVLAENTDAEFPVVSSADAESSTFICFTTPPQRMGTPPQHQQMQMQQHMQHQQQQQQHGQRMGTPPQQHQW